MGDLIVFTRRTTPPQSEASRTGNASILFFTGVRYMRMPEPEASCATLTPTRATRPRRGPRKTRDTKIA